MNSEKIFSADQVQSKVQDLAWMAALAGIMLLAGFVRLPGLASKGLSNDEAYSWRISQYSPAELVHRTRWDANPPLYYLVLQLWEIVCGTSPLALRGLSVLLSMLAVAVSYAACVQAVKLNSILHLAVADRLAGKSGTIRGGALFAAFLVAVHPVQVVAGQTARMYELGVFLAAVTSWLLLKALADERRPLLWWTGYGVGAAAFAYTHYYAFFALAGQGLFALLFLGARARKSGWSPRRGQAGWFLFAVFLASILYAPWLRVFLAQSGDVREGFWIPPVDFNQVENVFWPWCTGLSHLDRLEKIAWLIVAAGCLAWTCYSRSGAAGFFLCQAVLPWLLSIGLSLLWQRSILYDRYLTFAQWALLCYWGTAWAELPVWPVRVFLTCLVALSAAWGLSWGHAEGPPALAQAAAFLKEHYQPGDQVWVQGAAELNRLRYYAAQEGLKDLPVKCSFRFAGQKGHMVHLASLSGEDILESDAFQKPPPRFWQAGDGYLHAIPERAKKVVAATFSDGLNQYTLALYETKR